MKRLITHLRHLLKSREGIVSVEFAMAMPILLGLMLTGLEMTRYVFLHQKLERVSTSISDLVAREEIITEAKVTDIFEITEQLMAPFDHSVNIQVIVTSLNRNTGAAATVSWQRNWGVGSHESRFGKEGEAAAIPTNFDVREGENVIATEVFHEFVPTFGQDVIGPTTIEKMAIYRPRFGSLANLISD
ncbi:TadE/TadG family type IV pilus assembly protein [Aestuariispira insulae]|uniref:TadE-like protein n=1 Tax=Aestuariispira insulae TaxID=1461337 RepID=A0A3D9HVJ5_9PROT|nr:TadE/TadG family type IV pilus assembly protein [Aestuariispira insulae]RED53449.1 TadE-like protein [Aestuariispira insulae]